MRTVDHGFDLKAIRRLLDKEDWQDDPDNPQGEMRLLFLGTTFSLTPSGKFYVPFACSNVAGDCPVCKGEGKVEPRTGKRIRKRAEARARAFARRVARRGFLQSKPGKAYADRVRRFRDRACKLYIHNLTCTACDGLGSISAAKDERWHEAVENAFHGTGFFLHCDSGDYFAAECRDKEDEEPEDNG